MSWLEDLNAVAIATVRDRLGARLAECPRCGATRRSRSDKRSPLQEYHDRIRCYACPQDAANISPLDLVCLVRKGAEWNSLTGVDRDELRQWTETQGFSAAPPKPAARPARPSQMPPSVKRDPQFLAFCKRRGWGAEARKTWAADDTLAVWPRRYASWPYWWPSGAGGRHRLVVRTFESDGSWVAVVGRDLGDAKPKTAWPSAGAGSARGLLMGGEAAAKFLRGETRPSVVLVAEGVTDTLWGTHLASTLGDDAVCVGGASGSFSALARVRWTGQRVYACTDPDEAGDRYAAEVAEALRGSDAVVLRARPAGGSDLCSVGVSDLRAFLDRATKCNPEDDALEQLRRCAEQVRSVTTPGNDGVDERRRHWIAFVSSTTPEHVAAADEREVDVLLEELRGARGLASNVDRFRKKVDRARRASSRDERRRREEKESSRRSSRATSAHSRFRRVVPDHITVPKIPEGWRVDRTGVWDDEDKRVCGRPLLLNGRAVDVDTGAVTLRLAWRCPGRGWRQEWVPRSVTRSAQALVDWGSDLDLPVDMNNGRRALEYLGAVDDANDGFEESVLRTTRHMGWVDGRFSLGREDDEVRLAVADPTLEHVTGGWRPRGDIEGWFDVAGPVLSEYPRVALAVVASVASPMLAVVGRPPFFVEWSDESSRGKTTTLRLAASVWGSPEDDGGVLQSWDTTQFHAFQIADFLRHLPLMLDETRRAVDRDARIISQIVMAWGSGKGRGRGSTTRGGIRKCPQWKSILMSTGEAEVVRYCPNAGARGRGLCVRGAPFVDEHRSSVVLRLENGIERHHGHLGPRVIRDWLSSTEQVKQSRIDVHESLTEEWVAQASTAMGGRLAKFAATLDWVARLLSDWYGLRFPGVVEVLREAVRFGAMDGDRPAEAHHEVVAWVTGAEASFCDSPASHATARTWSNPTPPPGGWWGAWMQRGPVGNVACVQPQRLKQFLSRAGYDEHNVLRAWVERGWLLTEADSDRPTKRVQMGNGRARLCCVVLSPGSLG